ncbi:MAG: LysR family transcriptional regulator [Gammaproteobacteria bacterium]|nr:LysR family transcriptional regulator [Gammaproteobacteria bacterium]
MPNIDQLQAFVSAADHGSFSAAARQLGKAQSAVSTAVINLEIDTGIDLFDRSRRNPVLTEAGQVLLKYARTVLQSNTEFMARATSVSEGIEARFGIAVEQGIFVHSLMDLFNELALQFPLLDVEIFDPGPNDVAELIKNDRADIGIMTEQESYPQGLFFRGVGHSLQIPVCSPDYPLAQLGRVSHADLRQYRQLVMHSRSSETDHPLREQKSPKIWSSESPYMILDLVMSGLGWAELPWTVVAEKLQSGEMVRLNYEFQQADILYGVDVVWTERRALGSSGQWLLKKLLELDPGLWKT